MAGLGTDGRGRGPEEEGGAEDDSEVSGFADQLANVITNQD